MIEREKLIAAIPYCLTETNLPLPQKYPGKVRDTYDLGDGRLLLITTDRQSGFDRMLGAIPFKGQVLNRTSLSWFEATKHIVAGVSYGVDRYVDMDAVCGGGAFLLWAYACRWDEEE